MENYLRFIYGLIPNYNPPFEKKEPHVMTLLGDHDGNIDIISQFGDNPPEILVMLESVITTEMDKIKLLGQELDPSDMEQVLTNIFTRVLGPANHEDKFIDKESGNKMVKMSWIIDGGELVKVTKLPATDIELMDKKTVEYQEYLLQVALKKEDYKKSIKIRDKIKRMKTKV